MACLVCNKRKGKRFCPAKAGKICTTCCATEREETIDCPLHCPHLQESRRHEHKSPLDPADFPYKEVRVTASFLRDHEELLIASGRAVLTSALESPQASDRDTREALDALIQTYKTLDSGIYYETRPDSVYARDIMRRIREQLQKFQEDETRQTGFSRTRDSDIHALLVFLYRMALDHDNGRSRGKAFLDFLLQHFPVADAKPARSLILPGA
jgi:hypothetical protein